MDNKVVIKLLKIGVRQPRIVSTVLGNSVVSIDAITNSSIAVSWLPIEYADGYILQRSTTSSFASPVDIYRGVALSFKDTGLASEMTYNYRVIAASLNFEDSTSNIIPGTTLKNPLSAPILNVVSISHNAINLSWEVVNKAAGYQLSKSTQSDLSDSRIVYNGPLLSYNDTEVEAQSNYYYSIKATAFGYEATASEIKSVITPASPIDPNVAYVLFISGQSNAQGNAEAREALYSPIKDFAPDIYSPVIASHILNVANKTFEPVTVGTNARPSGFGYPKGFTYEITEGGLWAGPTYYGDFLGPEYGLAHFCLETGYPLYIVKYAMGGTSISLWRKGTQYYNDFKTLKDAALTQLTAAGKTIKIAGFYRNQGEADVNMDNGLYDSLLRQLYIDLEIDGFITSDTKIIECGCPIAADGGIPYKNPQNAVKKAWVAEKPTKRFYIDESNVTLEHDEIHYDLPTQYYYGNVLIPNILFKLNQSLPDAVNVPAPTLIHEAGTNRVRVKPPYPDWRQMEYYFVLNNAAPKRFTTSFYINMNNDFATPGNMKVYSRSVAGRNQSPIATNAVLWAPNANAPIIDTEPAAVVILENRTLTSNLVVSGSGLTCKLYKEAESGDMELYSGSATSFSKTGVISDSGNYYWLISNTFGVAFSKTFKVLVAPTPTGLVTKLPDIGRPYLGVFEAETGLQNQVIGKNNLSTISSSRTPKVSGTLGGKPAWIFDKLTSDALIFNDCGNTQTVLLAGFVLKANSFDTNGTIILETVGGSIWSSINMGNHSHLQGLEMSRGVTTGVDTVIIFWLDKSNVAHVRINGVDCQTTGAGGISSMPGNASLRVGGFTVDEKYDFDGLLGAHVYSEGSFDVADINALEAALKASRNLTY